MDHIIIHKEGKNLKDNLDALRFSYQRPYTLYFSSSHLQLKRSLQQNSQSLLYYFTDILSDDDRIILQNILQSLPDTQICLCTQAAFAVDAWQLDVFYFTPHPVKSDAMIYAYRKYISSGESEDKELHLKDKDGLIKVPTDKICYIKASGNYSHIQMQGGKSYLPTKQLQHFEDLCEGNRNLERIHRSLIINYKKIKNIGGEQIHFYNLEKPLAISKALETKIKRRLLGKS